MTEKSPKPRPHHSRETGLDVSPGRRFWTDEQGRINQVLRLPTGEHHVTQFTLEESDSLRAFVRHVDEHCACARSPWADPEPGDVWLLNVDGTESAYLARRGGHLVHQEWATHLEMPADVDRPTSGRRIYPPLNSEEEQ